MSLTNVFNEGKWLRKGAWLREGFQRGQLRYNSLRLIINYAVPIT